MQHEFARSPIDRVVRHLGLDHVVVAVRIDRRGARAVLRGSDEVMREVDCEFDQCTWTLWTYGLDLDHHSTTTIRPSTTTRMRVEMLEETAARLRYMSGARGVSVDQVVEDLVRDAMEGSTDHERTESDQETKREHRPAHRRKGKSG